MRSESRRAHRFLAVIFAMVLSSCGGGGGSSSTPSPSGTENYLFYSVQDSGGNIQTLLALDPANPTDPASPVETGPIRPNPVGKIPHGIFDPTTKRISQYHLRSILYSKGGMIYKVSALKQGSLVPVQVSDESSIQDTGTNRLCGNSYAGLDFASHDDTRVIYALAGPDASCGTSDDVWRMVRLGMGNTTPPVSAREPLLPLSNPSTGGMSGWLVQEGSILYRYDADFGSPVTVATGVPAGVTGIIQAKTGDAILEVGNSLKRYVFSSHALTDIHTSPTCCGSTVSDGTYLFFADGTGLYRYPMDGLGAATLIATETSDLPNLWHTANRIVYDLSDQIRTANKTDGVISPIHTASPGQSISIRGTAGEFVYFTILSAASDTAALIRENGSGLVLHPDADWEIDTLPVDFDPTADLSTGYIALVGRDSADNTANQPVISYQAATGTLVGDLGIVPGDVNRLFFSRQVPGSRVLLTGNDEGGFDDVFFVDAAAPDSLARVTDTPGVNEVGCTVASGKGAGTALPWIITGYWLYRLRRRRTL
jgi:hypothetical protein